MREFKQYETASIYSLQEKGTNDIRYIGKTVKLLRKRLEGHRVRAKSGDLGYCPRWIRGVLLRNSKVEIIEIDNVPINEWEFWESHYISLYKSWGFKLTNMTEGGVGVQWKNLPKETQDHSRIKKKSLLPRMERKPLSEEALAKLKIARLKGHETIRNNQKEITRKIQETRKNKGLNFYQYKRHTLSDEQLNDIYTKYNNGKSMNSLTKEFPVSCHTIKLILIKQNIIIRGK